MAASVGEWERGHPNPVLQSFKGDQEREKHGGSTQREGKL